MGGLFFHCHQVFHKFSFRKSGAIYDFLDFKDSLGNGACLVHYYGIHFGHCIEEGGTFEQDSISGSCTETTEITERN